MREQRRRHEHRDLLARLHRHERGAQRHLGLAEADIAADHAVHGLARFHVADYLIDGGGLIGGFLEPKGRLKGAVLGLAGLHGRALARGAARIQIEQLRRHVADALGRLAAGFLPLIPAELVERCGVRRRAGVAGDQVKRLNRDVELVAVGVFEHQELAGVAGHIHGLQPHIAAHAVGLVHHGGADAQVGKLLEDLGRIALRAPPPPFLPRPIAEQLRLGQYLEPRRLDRQPRNRAGDADAEVRVACSEG